MKLVNKTPDVLKHQIKILNICTYCGGKHMILSLQGCMVVGKTTAVRYLRENAPCVNISYEINTNIIEEVNRRQLDKNKYEDYVEI